LGILYSFLLILIVVLIACIFFLKKRKSNVGYTLYKSTGVRHDFPDVDLDNQMVRCIVTYKGKTYLSVIVDVKTDTVVTEGSLDSLGEKAMEIESYIDMFKRQARFFIENNISNPKDYFEKLN
jgi:hypothetical protein